MEIVQNEAVKGGNKSAKGPWVVHRTTKDGRVVTRHRFLSDQERQRNRERERNRRFVARKIFSGLRALGNYKLSKNDDTIDLLKALCEEAGWHVEQDGTVYKKKVAYGGGDYYNGDEYHMESIESRTVLPEMDQKDHNIDLKLSLSLASH